MIDDWKLYKAEFSIDPSSGVMVSCSYFLAKDIKEILSRMSPSFVSQLRALSNADVSGEFILIRPDEAISAESTLRVYYLYEISVIDELGGTRLIYTNSLDWVNQSTSDITEIIMKYENVHILWEREEENNDGSN